MRTVIILSLLVLLIATVPVDAKLEIQRTDSGLNLIENGKLLSTIAEPEYAYQLEGDYLYLGARGFQIWDVSIPKKPVRVYELEWDGTSFGMIYSFLVSGDYAYLGFEDQLEIMDISTPELTYPTASIWVEMPISSMAIEGNILKTSIADYDVSNKANPVRITNIDVEDVGVYVASSSKWLINTEIGVKETVWGSKNKIPILGNWDGLYAKNLGTYDPKTGETIIRYSDGESRTFMMPKNSIPFAGDWNGFYSEQVGVYDPSTYTWTLSKYYRDEVEQIQFGWENCIPLVGDWNGDGIKDIGVYNDNGDNFVLKTGNEYEVIGLGWDGVIPVVGDWNGDGKDDVGLYSTDTWVLETDVWNEYDFVGFGWGNVKPIVGDWNKDGTDDIGVYNPDNGMFVLNDNGVRTVTVGIGIPLY